MHNKMLRSALSIMLLLATLILSACGGAVSPTVDPGQVATEVAQQVFGTLTAEALLAPTDTPTALPTSTATPTLSPTPTQTRPPTSTPTKRPPTVTPLPTVTPTPQPAIGDTVRCDGKWEFTVAGMPSFAKRIDQLNTQGYPSYSNDDAAKGQWLLFFFSLANIGKATDSLSSYGGDLIVQGKLNGQWVTFAPGSLGTSFSGRQAGLSAWTDSVPPGITITAAAVFDVNPEATEWTLILQPGSTSSPDCYVPIRLDRVSGGNATATVTKQVNLRTGPGGNYPIVAAVKAGQSFGITGRNKDASWWQVTYQSKKVWLPSSTVSTAGPTDSVPEITNIAPPPATKPPAATPTPLPRVHSDQEVVVGIWGMKYYNVKRAKTVYWFGSAEIAQGTWLIGFVEFRNAGSGTAYPSHNLDFYLQDDKQRKYDFDPFGDAVLGAAWQFQAGHLYDDINPGLKLGIALPFDVPPDMGDVWLRLEQDRNFAMYLGNVSQMPEIP